MSLSSENVDGRTDKVTMPSNNTVLILTAPTASGKSQVALNVARQIPCEILSADSRQVYKHLTIGTAKPSPAERNSIPHHFVDSLEPDEAWNAGKFSQESRRITEEVFERDRVPFVVGGTGLYVKALVDGIVEMPEADLELRERISKRHEKEGLNKLAAELQKLDPNASQSIDLRNPRRVMRALEIYYMTGMTRAEIEKKTSEPLPYRFLWFGLNWDRGKLYARIEQRVDHMIEQGLIDEVRSILDKGYSKHCNALQSVGYAETIDYLEGKIKREEMVELIKQNTRRYAKRQMSWFGRDKRIRWIDIGSEEDLDNAVMTIVEQYRKSL